MPRITHPVKRELKVELTHDELFALGEKLARETMELARANERKKSVAAALTAEVKAAESAVAVTSSLLANRYDYRVVECEWQYDRLQTTARLVRTDTFEVIEVRAMHAEELDEPLPFPESEPQTDPDVDSSSAGDI